MAFLHISKIISPEDNLIIGIKNSVWGNKQNKFGKFKPNDYLLVRVDDDIVALGKIIGKPYTDSTNIWPDHVYPYKVKVDFFYYLSQTDRVNYKENPEISSIIEKELPKYFAFLNCKHFSEESSKRIIDIIMSKPNSINMIKDNSLKANMDTRIENDYWQNSNSITPRGITNMHKNIDDDLKDELITDEPLDEETIPIDINKTKPHIHTEKHDTSVSELYNKWKEGRLILQPNFQRQFVWDKKKSSRLIESALMRIPLPTFYFSQGKDNKLYVIDGQQRLLSFFSFIDNTFPDDKNFKLNGLQFYESYNNRSFNELEKEYQYRIKDCPLRCIDFLNDSDEDIRFEIFERLNTGSVSLNDQELRNCIYRGPYNELLKELASNKDFMFLLGINKPDKRMKDVAFVLRFTAFYNTNYLKYSSPMKKFLNNDMSKNQFISNEHAEQISKAFKSSISIIKSLFGENAFRRYYVGNEKKIIGSWRSNTINSSLYDVLMYSFADVDKNKIYSKLDLIRETFLELMIYDNKFIDAIELSTSSAEKVRTRFDKWRIVLQDILDYSNNESRLFSYKFKQQLFDNDSTCSICGQKIHILDDANVDHIIPYFQGGKTIPENGRLTHRFCNLARKYPDNNLKKHYEEMNYNKEDEKKKII